jgi:hypothetical protein
MSLEVPSSWPPREELLRLFRAVLLELLTVHPMVDTFLALYRTRRIAGTYCPILLFLYLLFFSFFSSGNWSFPSSKIRLQAYIYADYDSSHWTWNSIWGRRMTFMYFCIHITYISPILNFPKKKYRGQMFGFCLWSAAATRYYGGFIHLKFCCYGVDCIYLPHAFYMTTSVV